MSFKDKIKELNVWEYFGILLFVISLLGVLYFNLSDNRLSLDPDYAITVYHGREMVKHHTLVLDNWKPTTSMEYDNSLLFAVPLYAITGNMFLSVGLSNLIIVGLFIWAIWTILRIMNVGIGLRCWALAIILTPYSWGWLDYFKMLFFAHANYGVKALVPVLLILNILSFGKKEGMAQLKVWERNVFFGLYVVLLFITCASTGLYSFVCGVAPIFMMEVINLWRDADNHRIKEEWLVWASSFAAGLIGIVTYNKIFTSQSPVPSIITSEDFADNFRAVLVGVYQAFGAFAGDDVPVYSLEGIYYCLKIAFVSVVIIAVIAVVVMWFKKAERYDSYILFAVVMPFNMLILLLGDLRGGNSYIPYRYLLIAAPVLLVGVCLELNEWQKSLKKGQVLTLMLCVCAASLFMIGGNLKVTKEKMMDKDYIVDMTNYFKTLDAETIFLVNDKDTALMCKAVDDSHKYACYMVEDGNIPLEYSYYYEELGFDYYGDRNIIAIPNYSALTDYFSEEIAAGYEYVGEVRWLACYVSDTNYFK